MPNKQGTAAWREDAMKTLMTEKPNKKNENFQFSTQKFTAPIKP